MTITITEFLSLFAFGLAMAYAAHVKEQRNKLAFVLKALIEDEAKYRILRDEYITTQKELDSARSK